ncbi:hypothetical protein [Agarivorans gilvus]|uniref:hypothetical protein n=1 Tax=Agarivorans gilvus TaxID=680279 RepID=UPI0006EBE4DA|nr:hypothetical protein [Agarivorans gilvus]
MKHEQRALLSKSFRLAVTIAIARNLHQGIGIQQHANITVAKLSELASCSLSEARAARFVEQEL